MEINRVIWASRRGMLELDLILQPFVEKVYPLLQIKDQELYHQLLEEQDTDLFNWFLNRQNPENPGLQRIVQIIRDHARQKHS